MKLDDFLLGFFIGGILGIIVHSLLISNEPSAIEVYQNKTTLEYRIVDSVTVDSVVVYKNKKE